MNFCKKHTQMTMMLRSLDNILMNKQYMRMMCMQNMLFRIFERNFCNHWQMLSQQVIRDLWHMMCKQLRLLLTILTDG